MTRKEYINKAEAFAIKWMKDKLNATTYRYHNLDHVKEMKDVSLKIAHAYNLDEAVKTNIEIACWFHDLGYCDGPEGHEERSAEIMRDEMSKAGMSEEQIDEIALLILATRMAGKPETLPQKIIKDADCHHVGTKRFFDKTALLKSELELTSSKTISEKEWIQENLKFLHQHKFLTTVAQENFNERKRKNILKIQKRLSNLVEYENQVVEIDPTAGVIPAELADGRADRGIETMFRVTLRNHNNLSVIADNKANIMLSINAIMLSIILSSLAPKLDTNPTLMIPTIIMTLVCVTSVMLAILATRPKISSASYSDEKFLDKKFNMLFFGNFFNLPLDKFQWGIKTLMNNEDMLYTSLSQDLYFLGVVLARKYRLLYLCYNVFAVGIILTAIAFIYAFATMDTVPPEYLNQPAN